MFRGQVRARQLAAVASLTPVMMMSNIANASALMLLLYILGDLPRPIAIWGGLVCVFAIYTYWRTARRSRKNPPDTASVRAMGAAVFQAGLLGLIWTFPPIYLMPSSSSIVIGFLSALTAGMIAGGSLALYPIPLAAFVFSSLLAGIALGALFIASTYSAISFAISAVFFVIVTVRTITRHAAMFISEMRQRMKLEEQSRVIHLLLNDFKENGAHWLWETNVEGEIVNCSARLAEVAGRPADRINGMRALHLLQEFGVRVIGDSNTSFQDWLDGEDFGENQSVVEVRIALETDSGEMKYWELHGNPKYATDGSFAGYQGWGRDISAEIRANERIEYLATRDAMTGLLNAAEFHHQFNKRLAEFRKTIAYDVHVSVMYLDADKLKVVNDSHGHDAGDALIIEMGRNLAALADDHTLVGRKGGDEFQVAMFHRAEMDLELRSQEVLRRMTGSFRHGSRIIQFNTSIGISTAPIADTDVDSLMSEADRALYRAKENGGRGFAIYDAKLGAELARQRRLSTDLGVAIEAGELDLHFQPIVDLRSMRLCAFEALLRWDHPEYGKVEPEMIASIAENTGQIHDLGEYVLGRAISAAATWPDDIWLSANISVLQLLSPDFPDHVQALLEKHDFAPERLSLEIVETRMLYENAVTEQNLNALRQLGVRIVVDDFGVGYSSISYLSIYPVSGLKIDASLTEDCHEFSARRAVIRAIASVAKALNISVVAEGIERVEQIAVLRKLGCEYGQGYLLGRAEPLVDVPHTAKVLQALSDDAAPVASQSA